MKRDGFIWSVHAGILAALAYGIADSVLYGAGIQGVPTWRTAAGIFLDPAHVTTQLGMIVGWIAHLAIGGFWGLLFYGVLFFSGKDHGIYKGMLVGFFAWLIGGVLMRFGITTTAAAGADGILLVLLLDLVVYGGVLGFLAPRLLNMRADTDGASGWLEDRLAAPAYKPEQGKRPSPEDNESSPENRR